MEHALRPRSLGLLVLLAIAITGALWPWDQTLLNWVDQHSTVPLQRAMTALYRLTGKGTMPLLVLAALALLARRRHWGELAFVASACGGAYVWIDLVIKPLVGRARPPAALLSIDGSSFASGHATGAVVFSLSLAIVAARRWPHRQPALLGLSLAWILLVGLSALVVRAHWPSDVVAGYGVGLAWLAVCLAVWRQNRHVLRP